MRLLAAASAFLDWSWKLEPFSDAETGGGRREEGHGLPATSRGLR